MSKFADECVKDARSYDGGRKFKDVKDATLALYAKEYERLMKETSRKDYDMVANAMISLSKITLQIYHEADEPISIKHQINGGLADLLMSLCSTTFQKCKAQGMGIE